MSTYTDGQYHEAVRLRDALRKNHGEPVTGSLYSLDTPDGVGAARLVTLQQAGLAYQIVGGKWVLTPQGESLAARTLSDVRGQRKRQRRWDKLARERQMREERNHG